MISSEQYPVFVPNQVLSEGQMNDIIDYLEPQDRLTRTLAIGRGVICGLDVRSTPKHVYVKAGAGLTSSGFIVRVPNEKAFRYAIEFKDSAKYAPFWNGEKTQQIDLLQLVETPPEDDEIDVTDLGELKLADYVAILYLNEYLVDLTACLPTNCDNQGYQRTFDSMVLLVKKDDVLELIRDNNDISLKATTEEQVAANLLARFDLKPIGLPRPLFDEETVGDYLEVTNNYRSVCMNEIGVFCEALKDACRCYPGLISQRNPNGMNKQLMAHLNSLKDGQGLQYFHALLGDLYMAYNEFLEKAFEFVCKCGVETSEFSRHLMLGPAVADTGDKPTIYRHFFEPVCEEYLYGSAREDVQKLFNRIFEMANGFILDMSLKEVRITPESRANGLGGRAIPYYYNYSKVAPFWSPAAKRRCLHNELPSYYQTDDKSLRLTLDGKDFFRIEGHLGKSHGEVLDKLEELRKKYNLPFEVKALRMGELGAGEESGGSDVDELGLLYEIARLDSICFIENKHRFLTSIIQRDFEIADPAIRKQVMDALYGKTPIEKALGGKFTNIIDFSRNRVFETQAIISSIRVGDELPSGVAAAKIEQTTPQEMSVGMAEVPPEEKSVGEATAPPEEEIAHKVAAAKEAGLQGFIKVEESVDETYEGREKSKFESYVSEKDIEEADVPPMLKGLVKYQVESIPESPVEGFGNVAPSKTGSTSPVKETAGSIVIAAGGVAIAFPVTSVLDYSQISKPRLADLLLQEIIGRLFSLMQDLPTEVNDYDVAAYRDANTVLKDKALTLKDIIEDLIVNGEYLPMGLEFSLLAELVEIADSCIDDRLSNIAEKYKKEWQKAENSSILSEFIKRHPGIEHLGGVPKGGTFVLVYDTVDRPKRPDLLKKYGVESLEAGKDAYAVYEEMKGNAYENLLRAAGHFDRDAYVWSKAIEKEKIKEAVAESKDTYGMILEGKRQNLIEQLRNQIESGDKEQVVFDFCLPYIATSDCPEIKYIVLAELKLYLPKEEFCIHDKENYAFGVYPPGGVVTGPGVLKSNGTYYFTPSDSSVGDQQFSYKIGNQEVRLVVNVAPHPQAKFAMDVVSISEKAAVVEFSNLSTNADTDLWEFGDGDTSNEDSPKHTYDIAKINSFVVQLTASSSVCSDSTKQELPLIPVRFFIEGYEDEFAENDKKEYQLFATPKGGKVEGEGVKEAGPDEFVFIPSDILLGKEQSRSLKLVYTVDDQSADLKLEVFARPTAKFSTELIDSTEKSAVVRFRNESTNASNYLWNFGDGKATKQNNPTHEYDLRDGVKFNVTLLAVNGPCERSSSRDVDLTPMTFRFEKEVAPFVDSDMDAYGFVAQPSGGVVSGPGIKSRKFYPSGVNLGDLASQTITLVYTLGTREATLRPTVYNSPELKFSTRQTPMKRGISVQFINESRYANKFTWEFDDGSDPVESYSATHQYAKAGTFNVTLTGSNPATSAKITNPVIIKIDVDTPPPAEVNIPLGPIQAEIKLLDEPNADLLKDIVDYGYLLNFHKQLLAIIKAGRVDLLANSDDGLLEPSAKIMQFGGNLANWLLEFDPQKPLPDADKAMMDSIIGTKMETRVVQPSEASASARVYLIRIYRLAVANLFNLEVKRTKDLGTKLDAALTKITYHTVALNTGFEISKVATDGFELIPTTAYEVEALRLLQEKIAKNL